MENINTMKDYHLQKYKLVVFMSRFCAAWQNPVTRFLAILSYHHSLGYLGLENGKTQ